MRGKNARWAFGCLFVAFIVLIIVDLFLILKSGVRISIDVFFMLGVGCGSEISFLNRAFSCLYPKRTCFPFFLSFYLSISLSHTQN